MKKRSTEAEIEQRVSQIYQLLTSGATRHHILQFAASNDWNGISVRQVDEYIARARKKLTADCEAFREDALSKALAMRNRLIMRTEEGHQRAKKDVTNDDGDVLRVGDPFAGLSLILQVAQDRERLLGLYAPDKLAVTGTPTIGDLWDLVNKGTEDDEANTGKQPEDPDQD